MKRLIMTGLACLMMLTLSAQDDWKQRVQESKDDARRQYEDFRNHAKKTYDDFRRNANEEYAQFMEKPWISMDLHPFDTMPWGPKPPRPFFADPDNQPVPSKDPIVFNLRPLPPKPLKQPEPVEPITPKPMQNVPLNTIYFYGTPMTFHFDDSSVPLLADVSEQSVADFWRVLSTDYYDNLVAECLQQRKDHNLCDWAYYLLTKELAEACFSASNESVVLHMYLLVQSGYQTRIALAENKLCVLLASAENIYNYRYLCVDGACYYVFDKEASANYLTVFNHAFPKEKKMSLMMTQPKLAVEKTEPRTLASNRYPSVKATVVLNKNLIDFYNDYPLSSYWTYYSLASLSDMAKDSLYPVLRKAIQGKSQAEAANILINFVQTAFDYATDQEQFGYERPLFPDESLFYPNCDCEDRSILFACLVRDLMDLDVVLLHYPRHLATAVRFTDFIEGDYLMIDEKRYLICDPTYINAYIGWCMPFFTDTVPEVIRF